MDRNGVRMLLVVTLLCPGSGAVSEEVHTWTDKEGNVHYGDRVPRKNRPDSETLDVEKGNSVKTRSPDVPEWEPRRDERGRVPASIRRERARQESEEPVKSRDEMSCAERKRAYRESKACFDSCARDIRGGGRNIAGCDCTARPRPDC